MSAPSDKIPDESVDGFVTLFRGRGDVYGHDEGRCVKAPLDRERFLNHLEGKELIGVYPMVPVGDSHMVVWGCSDFDNGAASYDDARAIRDAFKAVSVTSWIERSRSKGFHLWVFAEEPVLAADMRNMFLAAHQVAGVPPKEVNPKQATLQHGQTGNYVRIPYGNVRDVYSGKQRVIYPIVDNDTAYADMLFNDFVRQALAGRTTKSTIQNIATMYIPPAKPSATSVPIVYDATLDDAMKLLSPLGKVIWRDGPLAGKDRSTTLSKLGHETVRSGLDPSQTKIVLVTADKRWGKYHLRLNGETEIDKLVVRVHST